MSDLDANAPANAEFQRLFATHREAVRRYLLKLSRDPDIADDLCQDVFLRAHEKFHLYDSERGSFLSWNFAIAHNIFLNYIRREGRLRPLGDANDQHQSAELAARLTDDADPASEIEAKLLSRQIREVILALPEPERSVFYLMKVKHRTRAEIAETLGMGTRTVSRKLVNAIELLRKGLEAKQLLS